MTEREIVEVIARAIAGNVTEGQMKANPREAKVAREDARNVFAALEAARLRIVPEEPTGEMFSAALDATGDRCLPYEAPRECGVPMDSDISAEAATALENLSARVGELEADRDDWRARAADRDHETERRARKQWDAKARVARLEAALRSAASRLDWLCGILIGLQKGNGGHLDDALLEYSRTAAKAADEARAALSTEAKAQEPLTLKSFGWAPGNYMVRCMDPGHVAVPVFSDDRNFGDKRAIRCKPCAQRRLDAALAASKENADG